MKNPEENQDRGRRPGTRTVQPPAPERNEQVPPGDDSDINPAQEPEQRAKGAHESRTNQEPRPSEEKPRSNEDSGCAC